MIGRGLALLVVIVTVAGCGAPTGSPSGGPASSGATSSGSAAPGLPSPSADAPTGALVVDDWVEVVADGLNLRAAPGQTAASQGRLPRGSVGLVVAGPTDADGLAWYAVAAPGLPANTGCGPSPDDSPLHCPVWFGWIAAGPPDDPWLARAQPQCPVAPTTIEQMVTIQPGLLLACFGGQTFTLDVYLAPQAAGRGCNPAYDVTPAWLHTCDVQFLQATETQVEASGPELVAHLHESAGDCDFGGRAPETCPYAPLAGQWIQVDGHFDDPAAATCQAANVRPGAVSPDPALVVYDCRRSFVVTAVRPPG